jgi:heptosyltransferase II
MAIGVKRFADNAYDAPPVVRAARRQSTIENRQSKMRTGVFLPNWIGDAVMAGPALRALRGHLGPAATIIGIMRPYVADVLAGTGWLDEQWYYAPRSRDVELGSWTLLGRMRAAPFDLAVLLSNSLRTAMLAFAGGASKRVGYARYGRGPLLTTRLQPPRVAGQLVPCPMVDYYLDLAYAVGCPVESPRLELATSAEDERTADIVWARLGLGEPGETITFNSSGAFGAAKLWPIEHFAALARRVATELDRRVLVLCGPSEREIAARIVREAAHPRVASLADEPLSIGLSKACVRRSRLLVTTDSGPRHFAVAFGVPTIGLYGPTPPIWGRNSTARELNLQVDLECLGCHERTCPLGHHRCMRDLTVDRVFQAVRHELTTPARRIAA